MDIFFKILQKISKFLIKIISIDYKKHHKFQNKNQITNMTLILSLLKENISPNFIFDIGCGHGEWFLKCNKFFPNSNYYLFDANKNNETNFISDDILIKKLDYFYTNSISRASKTMSECRQITQSSKKTGTDN